jgi:hypothetical protein
MARIPGVEPEAVDITTQSISPKINPDAAGSENEQIASLAGDFGSHLLHLQQANDIAKGSIALDQQLDTIQQNILQSNDYKGYGHSLEKAFSDASDYVNSNFDGQVKTELLNRLAAQKITRGHDMDAWAYKQMVGNAQQTMQTALEQWQKSAAYSTGVQREMYKQQGVQDILNHTGVGGIYTEDEGQELVRRFRNSVDYGSALTDIQNDPKIAQSWLKDTNQYKDLTPQQRAELRNGADRESQQRDAMAKAGLASRAEDAVLEQFRSGKHDLTVDAAAKAVYSPDEYRDFANTMKEADQAHDIALKLQTANINDIDTILAKYNPMDFGGDTFQPNAKGGAVKGLGGKSTSISPIKDFQAREKFYGILQNYATQLKAQANNDPASLSWGDVMKNTPNWQQQLGMAIDQSNAALQKRGVQVLDRIPNQYATQLADQFKGLDSNGRIQFLDTIQRSAGPHRDDVMRQLAPLLPPSTVFTGSVSAATMKSIVSNDLVPSDTFKAQLGNDQYSALESQAREAFLKITPTLPGSPDSNSAMFQVLMKQASMNSLNGNDDPVGTAVNQLFKENYDYDGTWRFPKGMDQDAIKQHGLQVIQEQQGFYGVPEGPAAEAVRAQLMYGNRWVYQDGVSGNVGMYYLRDGNGQQVYAQDGSPIAFAPLTALFRPNSSPMTPQSQLEQQPLANPRLRGRDQ